MSKILSENPIFVKSVEELEKLRPLYDREQIIVFFCEDCAKEVKKSLRCANPLKCKYCKTKKVWKEKYGVENVSYLPEVKEFLSKVNTENSKERYEKYKKTCLEKYGTENIFASEYGKEKIKETLKSTYGVEHPLQNKELKEKWKNTIKEKYGDFSILCGHNKYKYENETFDSKWEIAYYIYLKDHNIEFEYQPKGFKYFINEKEHTYIPDFKIGNKYYEIKGDHFFNEKGQLKNPFNNDELLLEKQECMTKNNVIILRFDDLKYVFDYINEKYGKDFLEKIS